MKLILGFLLFIVTQNFLFTQNDSVIIAEINIEGNKKTKESIILREITFQVGQSIHLSDTSLYKSNSKSNLTNTSLFNFIDIQFKPCDQGLICEIQLVERWYLWPQPIFEIQERNFSAWLNNGNNLNRANYGLFLTQNNFRGRKETIKLKLQLGYAKTIGVDYDIPYINSSQKWGFHVAFQHVTRHEIPITSDNNQWVFLFDDEREIRKENLAYVELFYRKGFYQKHRFLLDYKSIETSDSSLIINPYYLNNESVRSNYLTFIYQWRVDNRDNKNYPVKGYYSEFEIVKNGLSVFDKTIDNLYVQGEWKHFLPINNRLFFSYGLRGKISDNNFQSFYVERYLGRRELPRTYDNYVINGQSYGVIRSNWKYRFLDKKEIKLPYLKSKTFGKLHLASFMTAFVDAGFVYDQHNLRNSHLNNRSLFSYGLGWETTSYYDTVLRLEFGRNHLNESGIFVHFTAPI